MDNLEITKVSRHGVVLDLTEASGHRLHVRVFRHGAGLIAGAPAELPQDLAVAEVAGLLIDAAQRLSGGGAMAELLLAVDEEKHLSDGSYAGARMEPLPITANADTVSLPLWTTPPAAARPVLFFDVDGVLNSQVGALNSIKIGWLLEICLETRCRLVCISSWRSVPDQWARLQEVVAELLSLFKSVAGVDGICLEQTPVLQSISTGGILTDDGREAEIIRWVDDHLECLGQNYAILDDEAGHYSALKVALFKTEFATGLTSKIALQVIRRLQTGVPASLSASDAGGAA